VLGLLLRLWLWRYRWINPDEGAHLMDGKLVLDGLMPLVDFSSRQVLYTYILAGLVALVGPDYALVRLGVMLATALTTCVVFAIGRRLFGQTIGLLAAGIFVLTPLAIVWGPIVHMEPFASLAACVAVYALIRHLEPGGQWSTLWLAGVLLGFAFYVRESNLAVTFAALCALAVCSWREPGRLVRRLAILLAGFLVPCVLLGALYARFITPMRWWTSSLNPLAIVLKHLGKATADASPPPLDTLSLVDQSWSKTQHYLREIVRLDAFLLMGVVLSVGILVAALRRRGQLTSLRLPYAILYPWLGGLALVYGYWSLHRGVFPQYSEEFLPAFAVLLAFVVNWFFTYWTGTHSARWGILWLAIWAGAAFAIFRLMPKLDPPNFLYVAIPALLLAWWQLGGRVAWRWWLGVAAVSGLGLWALSAGSGLPHLPGRGLRVASTLAILAVIWWVGRTRGVAAGSRGFASYLGVVLLTAATAYSFGAAAAIIRPDYETPWSPGSVQEVAKYLETRSRPGDEVISGAVIWEFQADREPFAHISHPVGLPSDLEPAQLAALASRWTTRPPRFVVLDGYTEQTYGVVVPGLQRDLEKRYALVDSAAGSRYPVRVYQLRSDSVP
jgi:4-amino-4-deoxy-L-arabinose transferase-like glycosyltransferase